MNHSVRGIHHITAIASSPQKTYDFYTKILGLRLVKKSVNQDDTDTYHLFFGDKTGEPGMDLTFFTFMPPLEGNRGTGQVTMISLEIPESALPFWKKRFEAKNVHHEPETTRFGKRRIVFYDDDNQRLELVGVSHIRQNSNVWVTNEVSVDNAIQCFYGATLAVQDRLLIEPVLKAMGYDLLHSEDNRLHYALADETRAANLEVETTEALGINAVGTVHHIAFIVDDAAHQLTLREKLIDMGLFPTTVINRYYFKSVYFRTPAGILFELATKKPGFTVDEAEPDLGKKLALPPFLEIQRRSIEKNLTPIKIGTENSQ